MKVTFEPPHERLSFEATDFWPRLEEIADELDGRPVYYDDDGVGRVLRHGHRIVATFWLD